MHICNHKYTLEREWGLRRATTLEQQSVFPRKKIQFFSPLNCKAIEILQKNCNMTWQIICHIRNSTSFFIFYFKIFLSCENFQSLCSFKNKFFFGLFTVQKLRPSIGLLLPLMRYTKWLEIVTTIWHAWEDGFGYKPIQVLMISDAHKHKCVYWQTLVIGL